MQRPWDWSVFNEFEEYPESQHGWRGVRKEEKRKINEQGNGELDQVESCASVK